MYDYSKQAIANIRYDCSATTSYDTNGVYQLNTINNVFKSMEIQSANNFNDRKITFDDDDKVEIQCKLNYLTTHNMLDLLGLDSTVLSGTNSDNTNQNRQLSIIVKWEQTSARCENNNRFVKCSWKWKILVTIIIQETVVKQN